jgi:dihydropteroate synthase
MIESVIRETGKPVSVDTSKPQVMEAAVRAGADMINDVFALRREGALAMAASLNVAVCLMHMRGEPRNMQQAPEYHDVVDEVGQFLQARAVACEAAGIPRQNILVDPGFGFGKTFQHNLELFRALPAICRSGYPVLVGVSRKAMLGEITSKPVDGRMAASVACAVLAAQAGAAIVRVHDVPETVDALKVMRAMASTSVETGLPSSG